MFSGEIGGLKGGWNEGLANEEQRNLPSRGFRPIYYGAGMVAIMAYGFYEVRKGIKEQRYGTPPSLSTHASRQPYGPIL